MELQTFKIKDLTIHSFPHRVQQDQWIVREVLEWDCYELGLLHKFRPSCDVIFDIGGHIGSFGLRAKSLWPEAKLIACEPNRESYQLYLKNVEANGLRDCHILNRAVSYNPENRSLLAGERSTGGCILAPASHAQAIAKRPLAAGEEKYSVIDSEVELVTVEQLIKQFKLTEVSLAKWDCEGGEIEAFREMSGESARIFQGLLGEFHMPGGFAAFSMIAASKFPHLRFAGNNRHGRSIGAFWAFKESWLPWLLWGSSKLHGVSRHWHKLRGH
jgi:FkbM family methyltransferase